MTKPLNRPAAAALLLALVCVGASAQDRLPGMPRYARYSQMLKEIPGSVKRPFSTVRWHADGKAFEYGQGGKHYTFDLETMKATEGGTASIDDNAGGFGRRGGRGGGGGPERGRQFSTATSPDGKHKAIYRDRNLYLADADGSNEMPLTTDGSEKARIKYATASWVYGEELAQRTAMWWSPDSRYLAFYRFDEGKVLDYFLEMKNLQAQDSLDIEPYPLPGAPNPIVDIIVYDLMGRHFTKVDLRDGKPFDDDVVGHYAYGIEWSKQGDELLLHRTNRRQNVMEFIAANPATGACRVIYRDEWLPSWTENRPQMTWLQDGRRFIVASDRTGWRNLYLYDLSGKLDATLTSHQFDIDRVVRVDEGDGHVYYTAHSGDNPMKLQLHRVSLDGTGDVRLTDPALNHEIAVDSISPDGRYFVDVAETHDTPPVTRLVDANGRVVQELARSDTSKYDELHLLHSELITYLATDGKTQLYGMIQKPSDFDPSKKYPVLISVYGGPETTGVNERFVTPSPLTELGFIVASFDGRNANGRGKRALDAIYEKLGQTEIDDAAEGVKALRQKPYVDGGRVGIYGTSYGGFFSAMSILRHPDVYQAACAQSPPTDWRLYDSIYTERYMWIPQDNTSGYDAGSAMTYAKNLRGRLMIYFGTADNNVHPSNSLQLISALQRAGKSFEVQVGPDMGHLAVSYNRMVEFFVQNLIVHPEDLLAPSKPG